MQYNPMDYNNSTKLKWFGYLHRQPKGNPARQVYEEVSKKPDQEDGWWPQIYLGNMLL